MAKYANVQRVKITIASGQASATATINAVETSRTVLFLNGFRPGTTSADKGDAYGWVVLTNATTITANRNQSPSIALDVYVDVVEFHADMIQSVQYINAAMSSSEATKDVTISAVTQANTAVHYLGSNSDLAYGEGMAGCEITSTTNVNFLRQGHGGTAATFYAVVIEFKSAVINRIQAIKKSKTGGGETSTVMTSVNIDRSMMIFAGFKCNGQDYNTLAGRIIDATHYGVLGADVGLDTNVFYGYIVEFVSGIVKTAQRGEVAYANTDLTKTATLGTALTDLTASVITTGHTRHYPGDSGQTQSRTQSGWVLTDATTITNERRWTHNSASAPQMFSTFFNVTEFDATPATAPAQVADLTAVAVSASQVDLEWTAPDDGGSAITGYKIERKVGAGSWSTLVADTGTTDVDYSDTGLSPATLYTYRVSAINAVGTGTASSEASDTTDASAPGAPTGLSAAAVSDTQIDLEWTAPASTGGSAITGYKIERKVGAGSWATLVADTGSTDLDYSDVGLTGNTLYTYRVSAINAVGTGTASSEAFDTTDPSPAASDAPRRSVPQDIRFKTASAGILKI